MRVLFISRKYPPSIGGMENQAYGLIHFFRGQKSTLLLRRSSQLHLIWFIPWALMLGLWKGRSGDVIHLCDGVLSPVGWILKWLCRKPVTVTVHGLDLVYPNWIFQHVNVPFLRRLDHWISVSEKTGEELLNRGFPQNRITVVPNGVDPSRFRFHGTKRDLERVIGKSLEGKKVLLTCGRLVKRKGGAWFAAEVMNKLPLEYEWLVIGCGPEKNAILDASHEAGVQDRVTVMDFVSEEDLSMLYHQADLFVMPNIVVPGDREGFGLVANEAAACGLPVVASAVDGIPEAIHHERNGWLVPEKDATAFAKQIGAILNRPDRGALKQSIRQYTLEHFAWPARVQRYTAVFESVARAGKDPDQNPHR